jgi:Protein of unknown function (DUF3592)
VVCIWASGRCGPVRWRFRVQGLELPARGARLLALADRPGAHPQGRSETRVFEDENDPKKETEFSGFNVLYTYHVGGREYRSTRLYVGNPVLRGGDRIARALAAKYQVGKAVPVYYNPANPAIAMLEPLNRSNATLAAIMATGFGGMGLFMAYVMAMAQ